MCQSRQARPCTSGMTKINIEEAVGTRLAHDITEIRPGAFKGPAFRRCHKVREQDVCRLMRLGKRHLYILELDSDQVHEDDAVVDLATALATTRGPLFSVMAYHRKNIRLVVNGHDHHHRRHVGRSR